MKKIPSRSTNFFVELINITVKKMTGDLIGPVMIGVLGLLIKLIQTLSERDHMENKKKE